MTLYQREYFLNKLRLEMRIDEKKITTTNFGRGVVAIHKNGLLFSLYTNGL